MHAFESVVDEHLKDLSRVAADRGIPLATAGGKDDHREWLVRYQVCGESKSKIAQDVGKDPRTVSEAIHGKRSQGTVGLAKFLQLPKRHRSRAGRPRRRKTRRPARG